MLLLFLLCGLAVTAHPMKHDVESGNSKICISKFLRNIGEVALRVEDPLAGRAHAVVMRVALVIVVRGAVKTAYVCEFARRGQEIQVSVHRGLADARICLRYVLVDLLRCCVSVELPQRIQNQASLQRIPFAVHGSLNIP